MWFVLFIIFLGVTWFAIWQHSNKYVAWGLPLALGSGFITLILAIVCLNTYVVLVLLGAAVVSLQIRFRDKASAWVRPVAGALAVVIVLVAVFRTLASLPGCQARKLRQEAETMAEGEHYEPRMHYIGRYLAQKYAGHKVLLIADPDYPLLKLLTDSLRHGFDGRLAILAEASPGSALADEPTPPTGLSGKQFDRLLGAHPECNMVVCFFPLPPDIEQTQFWRRDRSRPRLVLVGGTVGAVPKSLIEKGVVSTIVFRYRRPDLESKGDDVDKFFNANYLLVDRSNVDKIAAEYPQFVSGAGK